MVLILLLVAAVPSLASDAAFNNKLIRQMCLASFDSAMSHAGKVPPKGMADYTCDCFLQKMEEGAGIGESQQTCKQAAALKFRV